MRRYRNMSPSWITARFTSTGACGHSIKWGEEIFYFPHGKKAYCHDCSESHANRYNAEHFDEMAYTGEWGG